MKAGVSVISASWPAGLPCFPSALTCACIRKFAGLSDDHENVREKYFPTQRTELNSKLFQLHQSGSQFAAAQAGQSWALGMLLPAGSQRAQNTPGTWCLCGCWSRAELAFRLGVGLDVSKRRMASYFFLSPLPHHFFLTWSIRCPIKKFPREKCWRNTSTRRKETVYLFWVREGKIFLFCGIVKRKLAGTHESN